MALLNAKLISEYNNFKLPYFALKNIDCNEVNSNNTKGAQGLLVAFICNHCPYVKAIIQDLVADAYDLKNLGINLVCINSNDSNNPKYSDDSFEHMQSFAKEHKFHFPYLIDETQSIAHKFDAVCTPDFFLFLKDKNGEYVLNYKGRLNNFTLGSGEQTSINMHNKERELLNYAKIAVHGPKPAMGCSIKWREK